MFHQSPNQSFLMIKKNNYWTKPVDKLLTISLLSKFSETKNVKNLSNIFSKIDIVVGGDHG